MKRYKATWGKGYEPKERYFRDLSFFTEDNGYSKEDIEAISKLWDGEKWVSEDGGHEVELMTMISSRTFYY